jgi:hypothetical protein
VNFYIERRRDRQDLKPGDDDRKSDPDSNLGELSRKRPCKQDGSPRRPHVRKEEYRYCRTKHDVQSSRYAK